ncbi:MAG: hybrid sensor histidine kinase/response regulator [Candidatus Zhuqueibacterota bacterium]
MSEIEQKKILVVDDSPTQTMVLKIGLEQAGFCVVTAGDGMDGVSRVYEESPDIVVSDIVMPELNGYQLCRLIKNDPQLHNIPVILLTNLGQQQDRFWGREAGADFYVVKDRDLSPLLETIQKSVALTREKSVDEMSRGSHHAVTSEGVKNKLNLLLDDLLFESTIASRIREIARFAYDTEALMENLFSLLSDLLDASISCLAVEEGDFIAVHINLTKHYDDRIIDQVKRDVVGAFRNADRKLKVKIYGDSEPCSRSQMPVLQSKLVFPFPVNEDIHAAMALFDERDGLYKGKTLGLVKKICTELHMLISYVAKLNEIEKIKADFTSMIVHDLRSPMAGVFGLLQLMRQDRIGPVNEKQRQTLSQILGTINKLLNLVNDMLDVSKLESGRLDVVPKKIDFNEVIAEALGNVEILAEEKQIEIRLENFSHPMFVLGDALRLEQVMINLLSNAIKFSPENSQIVIQGQALEDPDQANGWLKVSVQDSGIGIEEGSREIIFEKYRQTMKGNSKAAKGTGLGLAICRMIVQAHDGKIWVTSQEGQGSTFSFTVPLIQ